MPAADDQDPITALTAYGADEALGETVGSRSSDRGSDDPDAVGTEDFVEARGELGNPVPDEELD